MEFNLSNDALKGWRIVVVDDEPDNCYVAQALLESYGAEVHTAADGQTGLEVIRQVKPRFVVADVNMPKMDGQEMVRQMHSDPQMAHIPVIALSAGSMLEDIDSAKKAGFHNYLIKPLRPEHFVRDLLLMLMDVPEIGKEFSDD